MLFLSTHPSPMFILRSAFMFQGSAGTKGDKGERVSHALTQFNHCLELITFYCFVLKWKYCYFVEVKLTLLLINASHRCFDITKFPSITHSLFLVFFCKNTHFISLFHSLNLISGKPNQISVYSSFAAERSLCFR